MRVSKMSGPVRSFVGLALCAVAAVGCGRPILIMDDVAYVPGQKTVLVGELGRETSFGIHKSLEGESISFWLEDKRVGRALTDEDGRARLTCDFGDESVPDQVRAQAYVGMKQLGAAGRVYHWDPRRVVIAVDIDHTVAETDFSSVLFNKVDTDTAPLEGSVNMLWELERDYHLLYLTARPSFLAEQTKEWLELHDYPQAPVVMPASITDLVDQAEVKHTMLSWRRAHVPNLLIGIGDKQSDVEAYSSVGMLSIILAPLELDVKGPDADGTEPAEWVAELSHVLVADDWAAIRAFFDMNAELLRDPERLAQLLDADDMTGLVLPSGLSIPKLDQRDSREAERP